MMYEQEATRRVLVRKGLLTNEEVLEEIKAVRRELEEKRGGRVMGGKAKTWNRLKVTLKRSQLRKARKEVEKARKEGRRSGGVK